MMPTEPGPETLQAPEPVEPPPYRWYHKMSAVLFITFCLEIGFFLMVFPWTEAWDNNYFSSAFPAWHRYWDNLYVRGAVSGIGAVNLYISFIEIFRLKRFSRR
jgi:hypothetical protein